MTRAVTENICEGCVARALLPAKRRQRRDRSVDLIGRGRRWELRSYGQPTAAVPTWSGQTDSLCCWLEFAGKSARATQPYLASSGTTLSSSFSVQRSTVSEQLTPTRTSVSTRCRSSTPATG